MVAVAGNTGSRSFNVLNGSVVGSQPLYRPANRIAWDQGKRAAEAAQVQLSGTEQDLIVRLSQAYFDVLAAEESLAFVRALKAAVAWPRCRIVPASEVVTMDDPVEVALRRKRDSSMRVALQQAKRHLFDSVVGTGSDTAAPLSASDIVGLLEP